MAGGSILVINAAGAETRVALVENGTIHEYYLERKREKGIVGNIYKGRVVRVLPGMQAAFVDIGLEKAAFLYVGDVYGDPDFSEEFELTEGEHAPVLHEVPSEQEAEEQELRVSQGEPAVAEEGGGGEPVPPATSLELAPGEAAAPPSDVPAIEASPAAVPATEPSPDTIAPRTEGPAMETVEAPPGLTPIPLTQAVGIAPVPAAPPLLVPDVAPE